MKKRIRSARELTIWAIHKGDTNAQVVARVLKVHPHSKTTAATVNYLRNQIRKTDKSVRSDHSARGK